MGPFGSESFLESSVETPFGRGTGTLRGPEEGDTDDLPTRGRPERTPRHRNRGQFRGP